MPNVGRVVFTIKKSKFEKLIVLIVIGGSVFVVHIACFKDQFMTPNVGSAIIIKKKME